MSLRDALPCPTSVGYLRCRAPTASQTMRKHSMLEQRRNVSEVADEEVHFSMPGLLVRRAKNGRGMHRGHDGAHQLVLQDLAAHLRDLERLPQQRLRSRRAETDQHIGFQHRELSLEPWAAGGDLAGVGFLVEPQLPSRRPLEVLHDVRDVHQLAIDYGLLDGAIDELPIQAHERAPDVA